MPLGARIRTTAASRVVHAPVVRPDGFVGWRAVGAAGAPEKALRHALQSLQCRGDGKP